MRISHGTRIENIDDRNGYGYATANMINSLTRLGYEVNQNDKTADVEIWFDQPQHWNFSDGPYKIGFHPWESTLLQPGWADIMNQCDEIWTPSPLIAQWYRDYSGITVPVYVYEHGVDPITWYPHDRVVEDKFRFLHVGGEALRKGFKEASRAFRAAFPSNPDVELNCKLISEGWAIGKMNRINYLNGAIPINKLVELFHHNHVFVYPSWGEGFGLTPLQAMATGMPTICTEAWAPYANFLDPKLAIGSKPAGSPWPRFHPGRVLEPNLDDVVDAMRYTYENYDVVRKRALDWVDVITAYYDWDRLTKITFEELENRLQN